MDPLTITAGVMSVTTGCMKTARTISDLREKYKHAQATLSALCAESTVICASLSQIQSLILGRPGAFKTKLKERPELVATFDVAVTGCMVIFAVLDDEVQKLVAHGLEPGDGVGWADKAKFLWKESFMKDLLQQIRGQQSSLTLLMQAIQMESISDLHQLIETHGLLLDRLTKQTHSLRSKHPTIGAPASILEEALHDGESVIGTCCTEATDTSFMFDDLILNSKVYRQAFANANVSKTIPSSLAKTTSSIFTPTQDAWRSDLAKLYDTLTQNKQFQDQVRSRLLDQDYFDELGVLSRWYHVIDESERMHTLYYLLYIRPEMRTSNESPVVNGTSLTESVD